MIFAHNLIVDDDKIAVGVSGGKDSLTLLAALREFQKYSSVKFELVAIAVDLSNGEMSYDKIKEFCQELGVEFILVPSNVFEVIFEVRKEKNPCSLCANLRRGLLNTAAKEAGCNKVALGHHADDLVDTFILSMFFEGRLYVLQPQSYLSRLDINVIRPLLLVEESDIIRVAKDFPVVKNTCPKDHFSERENAKKIIKKLDENYPGAKQKIFNALNLDSNACSWISLSSEV